MDVMNLVLFERMPWPGPDPGRWGYLANADGHDFARVVLSPSQRSIPLYRRAGFGPADALLSREHPSG
jgi:hypothetical protein